MFDMPKLKTKKNGKQILKAEKPAATATAVTAVTAAVPLTLDYPQSGETVSLGHYAVRLSAGSHAQVEVAVGDLSWAPCRFEAGHFWFDWYPSKPGKVKISIRSKSGDSGWSLGESRSVQVK